MKPSEQPLISAAAIARRVRALGREISRDYADRQLLVIPVLKGGLPFSADLLRHLTVPVTVDFIRARSYQGALSAGSVEILIPPSEPLRDRHVLLVEDILDTGRTTAALLDRLALEHPASLALCVLLDKPACRVTAVESDYTGFEIDDVFVVGYGMDYDERFRELPAVYELIDG